MTTGMGGSALEVEIDFKRMEVYECGAILLTTLVYPTDQSAVGNLALFRSLCAKALWSKHLMNPDDESPITVNPRYVFLDTDIVKRNVRVVEKRLGERMVAARMAIAFLKENDTEAAAAGRAEPAHARCGRGVRKSRRQSRGFQKCHVPLLEAESTGHSFGGGGRDHRPASSSARAPEFVRSVPSFPRVHRGGRLNVSGY